MAQIDDDADAVLAIVERNRSLERVGAALKEIGSLANAKKEYIAANAKLKADTEAATKDLAAATDELSAMRLRIDQERREAAAEIEVSKTLAKSSADKAVADARAQATQIVVDSQTRVAASLSTMDATLKAQQTKVDSATKALDDLTKAIADAEARKTEIEAAIERLKVSARAVVSA